MKISLPLDAIQGVGNDILTKIQTYGNNADANLNALHNAAGEGPDFLQSVVKSYEQRVRDAIGMPIGAWMFTAQELLHTAQSANHAEMILEGEA